jgi:hypothetical protein
MTAKKSQTTPDKRRNYDDAFKAEALRLATESRGAIGEQQPPTALPLAAGAARGRSGQRGGGPRPGSARAARPPQAGRSGERYV